MEELINLFVEIYYHVMFSDSRNKRKPLKRYAEFATKNCSPEIETQLLCSIREKDWQDPVNGKRPSYLLMRGSKKFDLFLLDDKYHFVRRLLPIINETQFQSLLIKL